MALHAVQVMNVTWNDMRDSLMEESAEGVLEAANSCWKGGHPDSKQVATFIGYFLSMAITRKHADPDPVAAFTKAVEFILEQDAMGDNVDRPTLAAWMMYDVEKNASLAHLKLRVETHYSGRSSSQPTGPAEGCTNTPAPSNKGKEEEIENKTLDDGKTASEHAQFFESYTPYTHSFVDVRLLSTDANSATDDRPIGERPLDEL